MFEDMKFTLIMFPLPSVDNPMEIVNQYLNMEAENEWIPHQGIRRIKQSQNYLEIILLKYGKDKTIA